MAKLKNYEIVAVLNTIESKYRDKRTAKIKQLVNSIELTEEEKRLINLIQEHTVHTEHIRNLENLLCNLYQTIKPNGYRYGWSGLTEDKIKTEKATSLIKDDLNIQDIKNELIISNIEGNDVSNFIEEVLNRYNFND